jgi:transposase
MKQPKTPKPVRSSELVSRLRRKAEKLQKLRSVASDRVLDAELAYEELTRQCKEAWDEYHKARKRVPANDQAHPTAARATVDGTENL